MRIRITIIAVTIVAVLSLSLLVPAVRSTLTPSVVNAQAATKCDDKTFLGEVVKDLGPDSSLKEIGTKIDSGDNAKIAQAILSIGALRRKYEDMEKVPDNCFVAQLYMVSIFGSMGDLASLTLASQVDKANAPQYADAVKKEAERFNKLLEYFKDELATK